MAASMEHYVANFERAPVVVLPLLQRYRAPMPTEGASVYPACQNLLLAARALGYGGVLTVFHALVDAELHDRARHPGRRVHRRDDHARDAGGPPRSGAAAPARASS